MKWDLVSPVKNYTQLKLHWRNTKRKYFLDHNIYLYKQNSGGVKLFHSQILYGKDIQISPGPQNNLLIHFTYVSLSVIQVEIYT